MCSKTTGPPVTPPNQSAPVLLFDGVCNLCNATVLFVLKRERAPVLRFCALQSPAGRALLRALGLPEGYQDSLVLIEGGQAHVRSEAACRIAQHLRLPWRWAASLRVLPRSWRDWAYTAVARRRYRWFGRQEDACLLPTPDMRDRFLN